MPRGCLETVLLYIRGLTARADGKKTALQAICRCRRLADEVPTAASLRCETLKQHCKKLKIRIVKDNTLRQARACKTQTILCRQREPQAVKHKQFFRILTWGICHGGLHRQRPRQKRYGADF